MFCGPAVPLDRFRLILLNTTPFGIILGKVIQTYWIFLLGGLTVPLGCLLVILLNATAFHVHKTEVALGVLCWGNPCDFFRTLFTSVDMISSRITDVFLA